MSTIPPSVPGARGAAVTPVALEARIRDLAEQIERGVAVMEKAEKEWKDAAREFDKKFARSYLNYPGPSHERKYAAELEAQDQREHAELLELAFRHAQRRMRALELELSAMQTISKSMGQAYGSTR